VNTNLNHNGGQTLPECTDAVVVMASIGPDSPTGTVTGRDGVVAW
jgi:hypothetical protein